MWDKVIALFEQLKANSLAVKESLAKLTCAEDRVKAVEAELATTRTESSGKDAKIVSLSAELQTVTTAKDAEITTLKASVETEKQRATNTIAAQGLPADQLPDATTGTEPGSKGNAWATYSKLLTTNPAAAGTFYAANAEAVLANRPK